MVREDIYGVGCVALSTVVLAAVVPVPMMMSMPFTTIVPGGLFIEAVIVANARKLRAISDSDRKSDVRDARTLAMIGQSVPALLGPVEVRSEQARLDLMVVRARAAAVEARTALVNTVRGLAKSAGLSVRQVERLFLRHMGLTPGRYYMRLRLERARELLRQTNMPILDVAIATGFTSHSYFAQSYRLQFGRPPSEERRTTY